MSPVVRYTQLPVAHTTDRPASRAYWWVMLFTALVLLVPLALIPHLPLVDYPNHLAGAYVLAYYDQVPLFQQTYEIHRVPAPYLAMDVIIAPLTKMMNVESAGKLFIAFTIILYCIGCHLLVVAIRGRPTWAVPVACLWFYNSTTLWGFLNYIFGIATFLIALACWLRWRRDWSAPTVVGFAALAFACYFSHIISYLFLGLVMAVVCGYEIWTKRATAAQCVVSLLPGLAPLPAYFLWKHLISQQHGTQGSSTLVWNSVFGKVASGPATLIRTYDTRIDVVLALAWGGLCVYLLWKSRRTTVVTPLALAAAVFLFLFLALPKDIVSKAYAIGNLDSRFLVPGCLLLLFAIDVHPGRKAATIAVTVFLVLSIARLGVLERSWRRMSAQIDEATTLFQLFPEGAKVLREFQPRDQLDEKKRDMALSYVLCYAIPEKRIVDVQFFETGHMIALRDRRLLRTESTSEFDGDFYQQFEYVWSYGETPELMKMLASQGSRLDSRAGFTVWKLNHEAVRHPTSRLGATASPP